VTAGLGDPSSRTERRGWPAWRGDSVTLGLGTLCALFVLTAVFAPLIAPYPPNVTDIFNASAEPSRAHLLGTDDTGRDVLSRLIYGARLSLLGPTIVVAVATTFAIALSLSAVWIGGRYDRVVGRGLNLMFSFPALLMAILCVAIFGAGVVAPSIALAFGFTPYIARVIRSVALRERHLPYIEACELAGMSGWRICLRHLLPNILPIVRAHVTISFGSALIDLAAISYLGLGVQPPNAEWGLMVATGQSALLAAHPWESLSACAIILVVVIVVNMLGERMTTQAEARS
jgi:peptide/nickel transport system permease protein